MLKPANFAKALEGSIAELRSRASELEADVRPLREALEAVNEELRRLEIAWIRGNIPDDELQRMERDARDRRDRTQARLDALAPGDVAELERTKGLIEAAQMSLEMAKAAQGAHGKFTEAPPTWFTDVLTPPDWPQGKSDDEEIAHGMSYDTFPPIDPTHIGRTLGEALNRLQAQVWTKPGGLELRGLITLTVPPSEPVLAYQMKSARGGSQDAQAFSDPCRNGLPPRGQRTCW